MMRPLLLLLQERFRSAWNAFRFAKRPEQLLIATLTVGGLGIFVLILLVGITFLEAARATGGSALLYPLIERVIFYLFLFLMAGGVPFISATLLAPGDLALLAAAPIRPAILVAARLIDAVLVASGQFIVIGIPLLIACGWVLHLSLWANLVFVLVVLLFLLLPALLVAGVLLVAARLIGLRSVRMVVALTSALLAVALCLLTVSELSQRARQGISLSTLASGGTQVTTALSWLPSTWVYQTLAGLSSAQPQNAFLPFLLLLGGTLLIGWLCLAVGGRVLVGETLLEGESGGTLSASDSFMDKFLRILPIRPPVRGVIAKDLRYIVRDLVLLSQIGIPIILYLVPLVIAAPARNSGASQEDVMMLSFGIVGTIIYMETSILSISSVGLEGRGYWIVRGAPVTAGNLLLSKWLGAFLINIGIGLPLFLGMVFLFHASPIWVALGLPLITIICAALCAFGVGVAGLFPRFIYDNPAHRASLTALIWGFVGSTIYVVLSGLLLGGAFFLSLQWGEQSTGIISIGVLLFALLSLLTGLLPLWGARSRLYHYAWEH